MTQDSSEISRVELVWPTKNSRVIPNQKLDGSWSIDPDDGSRSRHGLEMVGHHGLVSHDDMSLVLIGDRLAGLASISDGLVRSVRTVYLDVPRLDVDNKEAQFKGDESLFHSSWLTVVRAHVSAAIPLLRRDGFVIVECGDNEEPYVRLLLNELMGRENYVGTIVWQRAYAPRNMKGMTEFTATHDCVVVFARDRNSLPHVGMKSEATGFANPDHDPRGAWKAEHKGAATRRESTDYKVSVPPYDWTLDSGSLPPGLWRVSPLTGVIWGVPTECGTWSFTVRLTDSGGQSCKRRFSITVQEAGAPQNAQAIQWLFGDTSTSGDLRIKTRSLPSGIRGMEYSAVLEAEGGRPFLGKPRGPGKNRYWEFAKDTLVAAYLRDDVRESRKSIPHPKQRMPIGQEVVITNQQTWWPGRNKDSKESFAGYTEDATKHLKKLLELGLISKIVHTAKPEALIERLMEIFTDPGDLVVELFGDAGDFSAVSLKKERRFVYLAGRSEREQTLANELVIPRLAAVVSGRDFDLENAAGEQELPGHAYIPFDGGRGFSVAKVGLPVVIKGPDDEFPSIVNCDIGQPEKFAHALLTCQGFFPVGQGSLGGVALNRSKSATVVPSTTFLTERLAARIVSETSAAPQSTPLVVFYLKASPEFRPDAIGNVTFRRVPFELTTG